VSDRLISTVLSMVLQSAETAIGALRVTRTPKPPHPGTRRSMGTGSRVSWASPSHIRGCPVGSERKLMAEEARREAHCFCPCRPVSVRCGTDLVWCACRCEKDYQEVVPNKAQCGCHNSFHAALDAAIDAAVREEREAAIEYLQEHGATRSAVLLRSRCEVKE
jgi:hypothetical protein